MTFQIEPEQEGDGRWIAEVPSRNGDRVESPRPVLLYDGTCGFCAESVQLVLRHDRRGALQFAALDSSFGRATPRNRSGGFDGGVRAGAGRGERTTPHPIGGRTASGPVPRWCLASRHGGRADASILPGLPLPPGRPASAPVDSRWSAMPGAEPGPTSQVPHVSTGRRAGGSAATHREPQHIEKRWPG